MKKKTKQSDHNEPHGKMISIPDFLLPPDQLLPKEETIKITIVLDAKTLRFFKKSASTVGLKYQRMIREVLKTYARRFG